VVCPAPPPPPGVVLRAYVLVLKYSESGEVVQSGWISKVCQVMTERVRTASADLLWGEGPDAMVSIRSRRGLQHLKHARSHVHSSTGE
jgi:hypothetical protein